MADENDIKPAEIQDEALNAAQGGLRVITSQNVVMHQFQVDPNPTLENYRKDVLYGGHAGDHVDYAKSQKED